MESKTITQKISKIKYPEPEKNDQKSDRIWTWAVLLAFSTALFVVAALIAHKHTFGGVELSVFRHINDWPNGLRPFFLAVTLAPESLWIGVATVIILFALKMYRAVWQLAAAIFGGYAAALLAKHFIGRPRPIGFLNDAHIRANETGMGFPSGHTMMVTIVVLILWPYLPKGWRWLTLGFIPLMGLSRIYLGVHEPLDTIGGFALGAMVVSAIRVALLILEKRKIITW
ncbi:MAG TPA: phosphatase PAP2 family protein [Patescibacteria group bacterium]|jgi:membrane-associated phospholipid phosphatase|nr:phosphatase PAP2 family protein [Patescibacteria group bacterium]